MGWIFLLAATCLDVIANVAVKISHGFYRKKFGILALGCAMTAFACLAQALQDIELSVAYAFWGAAGLCLTTITDCCLFGQRLSVMGWLGMIIIVLGVGLLHYTT
jgi:Membrane transporters of cations and cationic drugs